MKKQPLINREGEVRELTRQDISAMRPAHEILPTELLNVLPKRTVGQRGQQKKPTKVPMTLRYSPEVIQYFKETGAGWQIRMNEALKEWIKSHPHHAA